MYVVPAARGRGVVEGAARRARGRRPRARLDDAAPGDRPRQPEAIGLYTRAGYRPIAAFGAYVGAPGRRGVPLLRADLDPL